MVRRTFIPGSEWLYFKIYTGSKTADDILTGTLYPYVEGLYARKSIDSYFFIRYADPDFHIRFRLHIPNAESYSEVFREFFRHFQPCVDNGMIVKVMCDTYAREIERYGDATIGLVEELFGIDSVAIMRLIARIAELPVTDKETIRWQMSLLLLDDTLSAFGYEMQDKVRISGRMAESYRQEFGFTSHAYTKQLNDKYRQFRKDIEQGIATRSEFGAFEDILQTRKTQIVEIAERIRQARDANVGTDVALPTADELIFSIQHMTMNRWFRSRNRQHELMIYDFINKYYESAHARAQYGIRVKTEVPENLKKE